MTNSPLLSIQVITLFPEMFPGTLEHSIAGKALNKNLWQLKTFNPRDDATDKHQTTDDIIYGGGSGMLLKPDVLGKTIQRAQQHQKGHLIYLSPRGKRLTQDKVKSLSSQSALTLLCGRYEGIDQRVIDYHGVEELSIGDYILSGGEVAAQVLIDACVRLLPGVMGDENSAHEESFSNDLLEYPQYTRPEVWNGLNVPPVLLSGHHEKIKQWRHQQSVDITRHRRPDLYNKFVNKE
ncbi:MAG: tRNA (guanosine(37)-N1)-methyltransferase TrmD [Rickettsiales bacterium]|nr:tRNA (guanosine(37)-N1)-methyltransferase TrmD [Rickettsiales bacterium]|tara:strand:+ start:8345 stop:9052 length:708 start_codon:yes stop_codon:yes gene_type:complete